MRTDEEPIHVKSGGDYMVIPANCFDAQIDREGPDDRGFMPVGDILLTMLLPDLACRSVENKKSFQESGKRSPMIELLFQTLGPNKAPVSVSPRLLETEMLYGPESSSRLLPLVEKRKNEQVFRESGTWFDNQFEKVIYYTKEDMAFTSCVHRNPPMVSTCTQTFFIRNHPIELSFGAAFESQRANIRRSVEKRIAGFTR